MDHCAKMVTKVSQEVCRFRLESCFRTKVVSYFLNFLKRVVIRNTLNVYAFGIVHADAAILFKLVVVRYDHFRTIPS